MQCCGEPFAVGSHVRWAVASADHDFLGVVLGEEESARVSDAEEHHSDRQAELASLVGEVTSIGAVWCGYAQPEPGKQRLPLAGTSTVVGQRDADGWEPETGDRVFLGYLVDVSEAGQDPE
jgi:hypothetical protein